MNKITYLCLTIQLLLINGQDHYYQSKSRSVAHKDEDDSIENVKLIYCTEKACEMITSFKIATNNTFDCLDELLAVTFEIDTINEANALEKLVVHTYLSIDLQRKYNMLSNVQISSDSCQEIKKYYSTIFNYLSCRD